jgi:predicted kinase
MDEQELILTVGLSRSGKSTWSRAQGVPVVNPDSIRLALHGQRFVSLAEPVVWAIAKVMVRALFLAGHPRVILDATNTTPARRAEWRDGGWRVSFEVFNTPAEVCIARAIQDGREDLVPVIERMAAAFDPPSPMEVA